MALADEISQLKAAYGSACKVIENQGDFRYIITVLFSQPKSVRVQLALDSKYPDSVPQIVIKPASVPDTNSNSLPEECREDLLYDMTNMAEQMTGTPNMLHELFQCAVGWLDAFATTEKTYAAGTETPSAAQPDNKQQLRLQNLAKIPHEICQKGKGEKSTVESAELSHSPAKHETEKLPSLRTSEDVISRIMWDKQVKRSRVTVGYLDRFAGIMEDRFNAFCWDQPLSAVDNDTLAIPKHRIQYFKYGGVKIWDKNERLDLVFGSTGSDVDFYEFIGQFDTPGDETAETEDNDDVQDAGDEEDEDIDFDDLEVTLGPTKKYQNPNRPNFFIAVRMDNPSIAAKAEEISNHILTQEPMFRTCIIPTRCLHITLATVRLNGINEITKAISVLRNMKPKLQSENPEPIPMTVEKLQNFYQNVLYAEVKDCPRLVQLAESVKSGLQNGGVKIVDNHLFVPHMTIMKINRPTQRLYGVPRTINANLYHQFKDTCFGTQQVQTLFLCPVGVDRREDGFYQSVLEMSI